MGKREKKKKGMSLFKVQATDRSVESESSWRKETRGELEMSWGEIFMWQSRAKGFLTVYTGYDRRSRGLEPITFPLTTAGQDALRKEELLKQKRVHVCTGQYQLDRSDGESEDRRNSKKKNERTPRCQRPRSSCVTSAHRLLP